MLVTSAHGVPKPAIPYFDTGRESDFALLKMALDNVMNNQPHLSEHYKYQVLLGHLKHSSTLQLAKAYTVLSVNEYTPLKSNILNNISMNTKTISKMLTRLSLI